MGLFDFLFGKRTNGGDGSSAATAIVVDSIDAEYKWMMCKFPGYRPVSQALHHIGDKHYDVLTWENSRGQQQSIYFDITKFFGKY